MNPFFDKVQQAATDSVQTLLSGVKILLFSKFHTRVPSEFEHPDELVVLGNGPSLNETAQNASSFLNGKTLMAVNYAATSELYTKLKPAIYVIADPLFWKSNEVSDKLFGEMAKKTDWKMYLFMPHRAMENKYWKSLIDANQNISIQTYNTTPVEGFTCITDYVYKKGLGVPRPHNVIIPCIMLGLRMPFKTLYLAGVDHSWLKEIFVADDNQVYVDAKHFYSDKKTVLQSKRVDNQKAKLYEMLYHMYVVFKAYFTIEKYAVHLHKKIYNITSGSYIDAFERRSVGNPESSQ